MEKRGGFLRWLFSNPLFALIVAAFAGVLVEIKANFYLIIAFIFIGAIATVLMFFYEQHIEKLSLLKKAVIFLLAIGLWGGFGCWALEKYHEQTKVHPGIQTVIPKIESAQPKRNNVDIGKSLNKKQQPIEQPKLSELIKSDFPDLTKISREHTLGIKNGTTIKIFEQEYFDGDSRSKFFGFYVPLSPYAYDVCKWYLEGYKTAMNQIESKTIIHLRHVGEVTETSSTELVFSGRIYIYYEDNFSLQQLAELERAYQSQGLAVAFRGKAYLLSVWDYLQDTKNTNRKPLNLNDN